MKEFDALVQASRKPDCELAREKYEEFVEVRHGLLVLTVLQCLVNNAGKSLKRKCNVEERFESIVQRLTQELVWSKTSPLKKQEDEIKALMNQCVTQGEVANKTHEKRLHAFLAKYYTYANGVIAVSLLLSHYYIYPLPYI